MIQVAALWAEFSRALGAGAFKKLEMLELSSSRSSGLWGTVTKFCACYGDILLITVRISSCMAACVVFYDFYPPYLGSRFQSL
jgi:hypothetical protein